MKLIDQFYTIAHILVGVESIWEFYMVFNPFRRKRFKFELKVKNNSLILWLIVGTMVGGSQPLEGVPLHGISS
jgi:hypothetical protein